MAYYITNHSVTFWTGKVSHKYYLLNIFTQKVSVLMLIYRKNMNDISYYSNYFLSVTISIFKSYENLKTAIVQTECMYCVFVYMSVGHYFIVFGVLGIR